MVSVCSARLAISFELSDERILHEVARTRRVWTLHERRCLVGADETPVVERVNAAGRPAAIVGTAFKRYFHIRTGDHGHSTRWHSQFGNSQFGNRRSQRNSPFEWFGSHRTGAGIIGGEAGCRDVLDRTCCGRRLRSWRIDRS